MLGLGPHPSNAKQSQNQQGILNSLDVCSRKNRWTIAPRVNHLGSPHGACASLGKLNASKRLGQPKHSKEGTIASGTIGLPTKETDWTLNALENWPTYFEKGSGGTTTLNQARGHNAANEITSVSNLFGSPELRRPRTTPPAISPPPTRP